MVAVVGASDSVGATEAPGEAGEAGEAAPSGSGGRDGDGKSWDFMEMLLRFDWDLIKIYGMGGWGWRMMEMI